MINILDWLGEKYNDKQNHWPSVIIAAMPLTMCVFVLIFISMQPVIDWLVPWLVIAGIVAAVCVIFHLTYLSVIWLVAKVIRDIRNRV